MTIVDNNWLHQHAKNVTSQGGEDGILEKIFEILNIKHGWCVEFGAWDGKLYSNTYNLIQNKGWSGILIEGDKKRFSDLLKTYSANSKVTCLRNFVGFNPPQDLDTILKHTSCPTNLDLISIDIDSFDFYVWESIQTYRATLVVIEYNPTIPNHISFVQPKTTKLSQGNSLLALIELGKQLGYELIATTEINGFFVKKEFFHLFHIADNSIDLMRKRNDCELALFQLYDGTLVIKGRRKLRWGGERIRSKKFQALPKFLRYYSTNNTLKKMCRKLWKLVNRL